MRKTLTAIVVSLATLTLSDCRLPVAVQPGDTVYELRAEAFDSGKAITRNAYVEWNIKSDCKPKFFNFEDVVDLPYVKQVAFEQGCRVEISLGVQFKPSVPGELQTAGQGLQCTIRDHTRSEVLVANGVRASGAKRSAGLLVADCNYTGVVPRL